MSQIQFEEDRLYSMSKTAQESGFTRWLVKKTPVANTRQAHIFMLFVIVLCFALAGIILFRNAVTTNPPADLITPTDY